MAAEKIHLVLNAFGENGELVSRDSARRALDLPNAPAIGWVGRLSTEKGPDIALEAFARLDHPTALLVFIGDGRERASLESLATKLGVRDRVLWRGAVANVGRLFPAFDAFLLSSRTEGTPMVLLEAMAARVPIIATRVGGVPDVVSSESAWLVEALDVDSLAASLRSVIERPDSARVRVERAHTILRARFSLATWLGQYERIYRSVIPT
ncbi:MAG TPA: glycosyltransferase [Gemmatimonadaceae bacterium]|nr:glycosyltransferase [Gemmatimonadaceae bacterium]